VEVVSIPLRGNGEDDASVAALETLRGQVVPATIGKVAGAAVAVTGQTAGTSDFNETMKSHMPLVFGFVLALVFVLLLVTFRSLVVAAKAVLMNLLSVGAAYGILVAIFQHTWAEGILGFHSNGAIVSWLPLFLFVILFGLSMDYHVFILSRVKELVDGGMETGEAVAEGIKRTAGVVTWLPLFLFTVLFGLSMDYHVFILSRVKELVDRGVPTDEAVARGIRTTASTVTSAAAVMVAVFAIFATLRTLDIKQMGVGLAVAVLLDATIIRGVLLPAAMKLLGEWNWYLPRWLEWLPRLNVEPELHGDVKAPHSAPAAALD
ncbi:MAG TPA: MMPL family transporter, partial [Gaiellaceae bacterium]|nr:MMPL family transporter [Gaiellaceae bacterium]